MDTPLVGKSAFMFIGLSWLGWAVFYIVLGFRLSKLMRAESDGCLLAIGSIVLTAVGGGIGLQALRFPFSLPASFFGAMALPGLMIWQWFRRANRAA